MSIPIKRQDHDRVLDMWEAGKNTREISDELGYTNQTRVKRYICIQRKFGEPRAVRRKEPRVPPDSLAVNRKIPAQAIEFDSYTKERCMEMDAKFRAAMLAAIRAKLEDCPVGTYKANKHEPWAQFKNFRSGDRFSYCGSSAASCAEVAGAW